MILKLILPSLLILSTNTQANTEELRDFITKSWSEDLKDSPEFATSIGEKGFSAKWSDYGLNGIKHEKQKISTRYNFLKSLNTESLTKNDKTNYDLLLFKYKLAMEGLKYPDEYFAISQLNGIHTMIPSHLAKLPEKTLEDFANRLRKLADIPIIVTQTTQLLKKGINQGIMPYRTSIAKVPSQLDGLLLDFEKSPITMVYRKRPKSIKDKDWREIKLKAKNVYDDQIVPSLKNFKKFFVQKYLPKSRKKPGLSSLTKYPGWYRHRILANTTLPLSAKEVHQIGLREVTKLKKRMKQLMSAANFKGTLKEFIRHLKTDKKFFFKKEADLLDNYMVIAKKIDMGMPKLFKVLPRLPYGIKKVPDYKAPSSPTAYYDSGHLKSGIPGIFYANTYDLSSRPKWEMTALTLHEAVPGHHHQISIAQELENIPPFRKYMHHTAFIEGWALYAETLGHDIDLYKDPYSRFGQLNYDMWRSIRLVVDTGIHALGWSRQKAIQYFKENSALTDTNIAVEVDRYIAWPGQALGYKIGQLTFLELVQKARQKAGDSFDIRVFHSQLLENGSIPLGYLKKYMRGKVTAPPS